MGARKNREVRPSINLGDYIFLNPDKVDRVKYGMPTSKGNVGGLGEDVSLELLLAHYDRYMGAIKTKDGKMLAHGTFWNFAKKCPKTNVVLTEAEKPTAVNREVEVSDTDKKGRKISR